jgi:hypothetical protein
MPEFAYMPQGNGACLPCLKGFSSEEGASFCYRLPWPCGNSQCGNGLAQNTMHDDSYLIKIGDLWRKDQSGTRQLSTEKYEELYYNSENAANYADWPCFSDKKFKKKMGAGINDAGIGAVGTPGDGSSGLTARQAAIPKCKLTASWKDLIQDDTYDLISGGLIGSFSVVRTDDTNLKYTSGVEEGKYMRHFTSWACIKMPNCFKELDKKKSRRELVGAVEAAEEASFLSPAAEEEAFLIAAEEDHNARKEDQGKYKDKMCFVYDETASERRRMDGTAAHACPVWHCFGLASELGFLDCDEDVPEHGKSVLDGHSSQDQDHAI